MPMPINSFPQFNTGLRHEVRATDFLEGTLPYQVVLPSGDWRPFISLGEPQYFQHFDTSACVSFSNNNAAEISLKQQGYEFNFSDRFLAKASGTTSHGNSFGVVEDTCRHSGRVLESVYGAPAEPTTFDDYYAAIPTDVAAKAMFFNESYEYVGTDKATLLYHLKQAPIQIAVPDPIPNHAVVLVAIVGNTGYYFDSYPGSTNYLKTLTLNQIEAALKLIIKPKIMIEFVHKTGTGEYGLLATSSIGTFYVPASTEADLKARGGNAVPLLPDGTVDYSKARDIVL